MLLRQSAFQGFVSFTLAFLKPPAEAARGGALYRPKKNRQWLFEDFVNYFLNIFSSVRKTARNRTKSYNMRLINRIQAKALRL